MLREAAEYPNAFIPLDTGELRIDTGRYTLCMARTKRANAVQRQRLFGDDVDAVLAEVRCLLAARGRTRTEWEIGSAATPGNLVEQLLERGLVRDHEPYATAMALTAKPPPPSPELIARRTRTREEYIEAVEVQFEAFGATAEEVAEFSATLQDRWQSNSKVMHAVWMDGVIVSAGGCAWTPRGLALFGGATLMRARGRGAYRALIAARWRDAAARTPNPTLLTQAGAMSRPILEELGFSAVGRVEMLVDDFGAGFLRSQS